MKSLVSNSILQIPNSSLAIQFPHKLVFKTKLTFRDRHSLLFRNHKSLKFTAFVASSSNSVTSSSNSAQVAEEDPESTQLFEKLKEAERKRINKLEELERRADIQLERNLVMASNWSRALLMMRGKLKGTEWDPENSHRIDFSDFLRLVNSNNVQFMEYANYGQNVSVILPYYKEAKKEGSEGNSNKEIIFRRHVVDRMPIDCWNDVWQKLHQQIVNVDVHNVNAVPAEVYSTVATAVIWAMRLALSIVLYLWIDNMTRPIYAKLIPCDLGKPSETVRQPLKRRALGSLGKSRAKFISAEETTGVTFDDFAGQEYIKRELQEIMFVGVAASRVKDLFASARSFAPSIIFIDEIDAIGSKRGGPDIGGGGAEREQGLLQILTEMDGFKEFTSQVLVIGATNRLDILDPALLRKGRFDKIVRVGLPSKDGRLAILKVHARNKFFRSEKERDALLQEIAELTEDFTGAELQNILNEAGILTARKDLDYIGREELLEALKRQKGTFETGQEDSTEIPEELKLRLAYREAAVAILACYLPDPFRPFTETDINSITSQPNMRYAETAGRIFARKSDYVNSILAAKLEALRDEYMRYAVDKCSSVLREYHSAVETITDILLEKGQIEASEIWDIYKRAPRIPQPTVNPVDEYGALIYAGRWGIHGITLPGRVTFAPGNVGFATFGAPRPMETQVVSDETWKLMDGIWDQRVQEIRSEASMEIEEDKERPQLLMASHFL
ncbi:hypothetical protein H0E87_009934 [Populus deltoides]|uniref:Inactive ATP-dependent zinc metalloprotease FTSHI 4, chloroplastic n=1 Tax=Populus deltoides TaxID=3696 RepID=A0A8T2YQU0_POPDE|nr:hypothetical protein H0E87_009934 [Populus deltoides]